MAAPSSSSSSSIFHVLFILLATLSFVHCASLDEDRKVYIVYMGGLPDQNDYVPTSHHQNILQEVLEGSLVEDSLVRSYKRSFNGFAAKLTEKEVEKLKGMKGGDIVSIFPRRTLELQTTRSWDFTGFKENVKRNSTVESDVIVGILDSGIWPESESFGDEGFGPAPKKWKGACNGGTNFTCNNKLIGARAYTSDDNTRDTVGHGTHTSSTAAGNAVEGASFFGLAEGTARGAVPSARIAVYKICGESCENDDILAAFDDAIADGVDIISLSVGSSTPIELDEDVIAIGSFHALLKGILTSHSMGNSGPIPQTGGSSAPWLFSVAASSIDRLLTSKVVLGSGTNFSGLAVNSFKMNGTKFPILYGEGVSSECPVESARLCLDGCIDSSKVEGKIIVCDSLTAADPVSVAGAAGAILVSEDRNDFGFIYPFPATHVFGEDGEKLKSFIESSKNPTGSILKTENIKDLQAPVVVSFSSRGPNSLVPDILKPDITAPGVDILAAWSPVSSPSSSSSDTRAAKYSIISGTSMSCPHVTGAAAYVKTFHPDWSPSAIKSALMTTAWVMNDTKNTDGEFAYGAGHIDPVRAVHPGLVYDADKDDYVNFLCNIGYTTSRVRHITNGSCPEDPRGSAKGLNYPSMSALVNGSSSFEAKFPRTVTNVGLIKSSYKAKIITSPSNSKIKITVTPSVLSFKSLGEKKSFVVSVVGEASSVGSRVSASLVWSDGDHSVRSPIVVYTNQ